MAVDRREETVQQRRDREQLIAALRSAGLTIRAIAAQVGLSRMGVHKALLRIERNGDDGGIETTAEAAAQGVVPVEGLSPMERFRLRLLDGPVAEAERERLNQENAAELAAVGYDTVAWCALSRDERERRAVDTAPADQQPSTPG